MRVSSLAICVAVACGGRSDLDTPIDSGVAGADANTPTNYKVAYVADVINIWHSKDGSVESWTNYPVSTWFATFAYDGALLVSEHTEGAFDVLDRTGTVVRAQPTPTPAFTWIAPRPDFARVVAGAGDDAGPFAATIDVDGGYNEIFRGSWYARYSPDGHTLVGSDTSAFTIQDDAGGRVDVLTNCSVPSFSFDGKRLTCVRWSSGGALLAIVDLASNTTSVVGNPFEKAAVSWPSFTPDGNSIIYAETDFASSTTSLARIDIATGETTTLVPRINSSPYLPGTFISVAIDD
jgi:hypothetical protein